LHDGEKLNAARIDVLLKQLPGPGVLPVDQLIADAGARAGPRALGKPPDPFQRPD
jgi:hypothetical protein